MGHGLWVVRRSPASRRPDAGRLLCRRSRERSHLLGHSDGHRDRRTRSNTRQKTVDQVLVHGVENDLSAAPFPRTDVMERGKAKAARRQVPTQLCDLPYSELLNGGDVGGQVRVTKENTRTRVRLSSVEPLGSQLDRGFLGRFRDRRRDERDRPTTRPHERPGPGQSVFSAGVDALTLGRPGELSSRFRDQVTPLAAAGTP